MKRVLFAILALSLFVSPTQFVMAESGGHDGAQQETSAHDTNANHSGHGPNIDTMDVDYVAIIWTIIVFVLLLAILRGAAWKPVQQILVKREEFITDSLASARKEREDAAELLRQYTEQVQKAKEEAAAIIEEGRRDAEVVRAKEQQKTREEQDAMKERALRDIEIARDTAIKGLYDLTARLATNVAGRIIEKELSPADHEKLVADSIKRLGSLESANNN